MLPTLDELARVGLGGTMFLAMMLGGATELNGRQQHREPYTHVDVRIPVSGNSRVSHIVFSFLTCAVKPPFFPNFAQLSRAVAEIMAIIYLANQNIAILLAHDSAGSSISGTENRTGANSP